MRRFRWLVFFLIGMAVVFSTIGLLHADNSHVVYQQVKKSVWRVDLYNTGGTFVGHGSAVCIDPWGYLVTAKHILVYGGATTYVVTDIDGQEFSARAVYLSDVADFGLLKIESPKPFPWVDYDAESGVRVGDTVYSYGCPYDANFTFGQGIVNAIREEFGGNKAGPAFRYIQTDAVSAPGGSGGGLFNIEGNLIGMTVLGYEGDGMHFTLTSIYMAIILGYEITIDQLTNPEG